MRVLLTGGTGFVGGWTAKAVQDAGHQVRLLVRDPGRLARSAGALGVDTTDHVVGDITDAASVEEALDGCDAVIHCAAVVAIGPDAAERMRSTNLVGARHVLGGAVARGLDPIVHVSSLAAVFRPGLTRLTGRLPLMGLDDYGRSKAEVEGYVRALQEEGAPIAITYPAMVVGPPAGDQFGEGSDGVRAAVQMRVLPGRHAAWTVCDVRDLAAVHAALLGPRWGPGRGPSGWAAGGVRMSVPEIRRALAEASGRTMVRAPVPDGALRALGRTLDRLHVRSKINGPAMEYYTRMPESDNEPLATQLGVRFRDPRVTLADTVAALRAAGRL